MGRLSLGNETTDDFNDAPAARKRTRMVRPYPVYTLDGTLTVASAIQEMNAGLPFDRVLLAKALGTTPASSSFIMKLNSSAKYGLTEGGYNDDRIALTHRGESIVAPQRSAERQKALVEAALQPEVFRRFYQVLNGKRIPEDTYAQNVLQRELGVQAGLTAECLRIIHANGLFVGLVTEVGGSLYVNRSGEATQRQADGAEAPLEAAVAENPPDIDKARDASEQEPQQSGRIFIGHAGSPDVVDFIKTILDEFDIPYSVAESDYDGERPVALEASQEMRKCDAAVLVFARPSWARVSGGREVSSMEAMRYQLGAASVLYGDRVVSLKEEGLEEDGPDLGFHTLPFERERLGEIALVLLAELHRTGVVEVRARRQTDEDAAAE